MTLLVGAAAASTWGGGSGTLAVGALTLTGSAASSSWAGGTAPTIVGGASSSPGGLIVGGAVGRPRRYLIPGYERGGRPPTPATIIPTTWKELEKLQRAQPNTDTVAVVDNYELKPQDRTLLVDTSIGDVTIRLKPATDRFANAVAIVKVSRDFNNVFVVPAAGDSIGDALGLSWTDPFVAYVMRPDGTRHWWLEGIHDEVTQITPGSYVKVIVDKKGRVRLGFTSIEEGDITLHDITTLNVTTERHGLVPKLPGDPSLFFNGEGNYVAVAGSAERATATATTAAIADGATEDGVIAVAKTATMLSITVDRAARVIFYSSAAARTADAGRPLGTPATAGMGVLAEFSFAAPGTIECGPLPDLTNLDVSPTSDIYYAITNQSGSAGTIQVDVLYVPIET